MAVWPQAKQPACAYALDSEGGSAANLLARSEIDCSIMATDLSGFCCNEADLCSHDLSGFNFSGFDLSGFDLNDYNLSGFDLSA